MSDVLSSRWFAIYPFDRMTESAKSVLAAAHEEAHLTGHGYIGSEHLLLALLREEENLAARVLKNLGVQASKVRAEIESAIGSNDRAPGQQIVPTSRVNKVIEMAFEEARRMKDHLVGTEHLLLALVIEGEGMAAHVLEDASANMRQVRAEIERQVKISSSGRS